ncbi:MAG: T9SS type A sorting domain-containing protein [Ignavibacteria bacterium]
MPKIISNSLIFLFLIFSFCISYSKDKGPVKFTPLDGSESGTANNNFKSSYPASNDYEPLTTSSYTVHYTPMGLTSYYDIQSNGSPNEIWQNPLSPDNVHAAVMVLPIFGLTRFVDYLFSSDRGNSWSLLGNVAEAQSGFPSIDGFRDNGVEIISMHTISGGLPAAKTQVFVDQGPGFGVFDRLNPGPSSLSLMNWSRIITTGIFSNPVKYLIVSLVDGIMSTNTGLNILSPGIFGGWISQGVTAPEQYSFAIGQDGRIGLAYIISESISENLISIDQESPPLNQGSVAFKESRNYGLTWKGPMKIFSADIANDSLGAFGGINMIYLGNTPCVTYELDKITQTGIFPQQPSYIKFWSPTVNGGIPVQVAGPDNVPFYPNTGPAASYGGYTSLCRPVIGKTNSIENTLFLAFNGTTNQTSSDSNVYYSTFFTASYNGGNNWVMPEKITPVTPLKDYRYVSMSHVNAKTTSGFLWLVQMTVQSHDYAGAFAPNMPPGPSDILWMGVEAGKISEKNIVKSNYSLKENFPNPFNPSTSIKFDIQKPGYVTLKVYNSRGQEVEILVNNEFVTEGTREIIFNGADLASGIYFYTLYAGDFVETKKMMLIK